MHWNLCCTAVYSACNHHRTTCHHRTTYSARHHLYFCNFAVAGSVVNQSNLFYFNVLFHVAGRPSVCVRQATYVLLIFFLLWQTFHTFWIPYLPGSHSWRPFCEQALAVMCLWWRCVFVALSTTNTIYHVLLSTAWSSQRSVPRFSTHTHIYTHIHTHVHTTHNMIFFFQNRNMDYLNIIFFLSSFDRISKC